MEKDYETLANNAYNDEVAMEYSDLDKAIQDYKKTDDTVDDTKCPYTLYHTDFGTDQNTCTAHKFEKVHILLNDKIDVVGLNKKVTKMTPFQRAITLLNRILLHLILDFYKALLEDVKVPKPYSIDHNVTYETNPQLLGKFYAQDCTQLFTNNYNGSLKVTPLSEKELSHNKKVMLIVTRTNYYKIREFGNRARTALYLPSYVLLLHYIQTPNFKNLLELEAKQNGIIYADEIYTNVLSILSASQFAHYLNRIRMFKNVSSDKKFKYAMCDYNYFNQ